MNKKFFMMLFVASSMFCGIAAAFGMKASSNDKTQLPDNVAKLVTDGEPGLWQLLAGVGYTQYREAKKGEGEIGT